MASFKFDDWFEITDKINEGLQTPITLPIMISKELMDEYASWSLDHYLNSPMTTMEDRWHENPEAAVAFRFQKVISHIKAELRAYILSIEGIEEPSPFRTVLKGITSKGKLETIIFMKLRKVEGLNKSFLLLDQHPPEVN